MRPPCTAGSRASPAIMASSRASPPHVRDFPVDPPRDLGRFCKRPAVACARACASLGKPLQRPWCVAALMALCECSVQRRGVRWSRYALFASRASWRLSATTKSGFVLSVLLYPIGDPPVCVSGGCSDGLQDRALCVRGQRHRLLSCQVATQRTGLSCRAMCQGLLMTSSRERICVFCVYCFERGARLSSLASCDHK